MEPISLLDAAGQMGAKAHADLLDSAQNNVTTVCIDSRLAAPGALFFAIAGERVDGHDYAAAAIAAGAVAVVSERPIERCEAKLLLVPDVVVALGDLAAHYRERFDLPVAAITGSVGKTSTREMIAAIFAGRFDTLTSGRNYNNEFGVPLTLFRLERRHLAAVIEMGMRALGEIDRLAEIARPTVAVITNIGYAHIEILGSREAIAAAKSELLRRLPAGGTAILPRNSPFFAELRAAVPSNCSVITYSADPALDADVALIAIETGQTDPAPAFRFAIGGEVRRLALRAPGAHHVANALAAIATASVFGIDAEASVAALSRWEGAEGRMSVRQAPAGYTVLDDCYNAGPESMESALETLSRATEPEHRVAVLGEMRELGDFAPQAHRRVGEAAARATPRLLVTVGPMAELIDIEALKRTAAGQRLEVVRFPDTPSAVLGLPQLLAPDDMVLVKGSRALAMERIVGELVGCTDNHGHE